MPDGSVQPGTTATPGSSPGDHHVVQLREPRRPPRELLVGRALVVGRDCEGAVVDDPSVSRRHLVLESDVAGLKVTDLGSRNGTFVNGVRLGTSAALRPGDRVRFGEADIVVLGAPPGSPPPPRIEQLEAYPTDGAVLRFRPGTAGARAAPAMALGVRRAARRLTGLGPDLRSVSPQICLVDPFPDPHRKDEMVTAGSVVDADRREIWMAVTPESPPEPPERPLALLLGAYLPDAAEIEFLLEGYGLAVADGPSPDGYLRDLVLPPLDEADGQLRTAMAESFVRFLLARSGREAFLRLLTTVPPGSLDAGFQDTYGKGISALEESWAQSLHRPPPTVTTRRFLRLTLGYLKPHRWRELETFAYMMLALLFTTAFPFIMRRLLDQAIPQKDLAAALRLVGLLGAAFVVSLLAGLRRTYLSAYVSSAITRDVRVDMFGRMQSLPAGWFTRQQEGDILARLFSDVARMEQGISQTVREGIFQALSVAVSAAVLLTLNVLLGAVVLLGAPLVGLVYRLMAAGAQKRSLAVQEELATAYAVASENFGAQSVVKAFGLEEREKARFAGASGRLFGREVNLELFGGMFSLSVSMIATVLQLVVLALGSWLILNGHLTIGGLVAFVTVMNQVLTPVSTLTSLGQQIQSASGSLVRINEVLETPTEGGTGEAGTDLPPITREIRLDRVSFSYTPERRTLDGVSCVIPAGSRVAFVGPTGAGKSSVLQLLMRFYDADEGAVAYDGHDVRDLSLPSLRNQLGVVFQDTFLFDTTIRDNIGVARPGSTDAEIEAAARAAEMHEFIQTLPRGYGTLVGERGSRLSGGQRQRLAIARALLRNPRVLLLDEATSALDPHTERLIAATLERVAEGRTTIAVTHRLTSVVGYDRIFVLDGGRLAEQGTHPELLALGGTYARLWSEQTGGPTAGESAFDPVAALGAIQLFFGLSREDLAAAARRLKAVSLQPGQRLPEGNGQLTLVREGRPVVVAPGLGGGLVPVADLEPGEAFGIAALLGQETGAELLAQNRVELVVLDTDAIAALAARHPSVAAALAGASPEAAAPSGGDRLSRPSVLLRGVAPSVRVAPVARAPGSEELRRMSGAFRAVPS